MIPYCIMVIEDDSDREFMSELYLTYNRLMYKNIIQMVHDPWATEDILQTVLEKLIDHIPELRKKDRNHLVNYIITACKNRARNYIRDAGRHPQFPIDECRDIPDVENGQMFMEARMVEDDDRAELLYIWPKLDARSRELLEGYYVLEKSQEELANELGIQPNSVRMALTRARGKARKLLLEAQQEKL